MVIFLTLICKGDKSNEDSNEWLKKYKHGAKLFRYNVVSQMGDLLYILGWYRVGGYRKWLRLKGDVGGGGRHFPKDLSIHTPFSITEKNNLLDFMYGNEWKSKSGCWKTCGMSWFGGCFG